MCQVRLLLCTNLKGDSHENFLPSLLLYAHILKGQCHESQKYVQLFRVQCEIFEHLKGTFS
jgi:hypothetical protein